MLRAVRGGEDQPVAERERAHLGACGVVRELVGIAQSGESSAEPSVVRVQEVAADGRRSRARRRRPCSEIVEGDRRVRRSTRETRGRTELTDEEPAACRVRVAACRGAGGLRERGREDRRPHGAPSGRERALVAYARGTLGDSDRRARVSQRTRARGEDCVDAVTGRGDLVTCFGDVAEDERRLRVGERALNVACRLPVLGTGSRSGGGEHQARGCHCGKCPSGHYCAILTLSRAAACVTWPAMAVARSCAVRPSESACSGVKRRPAFSCFLSWETKLQRLSSSRFV